MLMEIQGRIGTRAVPDKIAVRECLSQNQRTDWLCNSRNQEQIWRKATLNQKQLGHGIAQQGLKEVCPKQRQKQLTLTIP